jgi:hypothetical protein
MLYCIVLCMCVLQVDDLRREALQTQRELLQEKTKVKALSEGEANYLTNCCKLTDTLSHIASVLTESSLLALSKVAYRYCFNTETFDMVCSLT